MYTIFLSHSSTDKPAVRRLARDLTKAGVQIWLDEWEIRVGDSITQKIQQGIRESRYVAIWLTRQSVASGWVQREWYSKFHEEIETRQVAVLPLRAEQCVLPELLRDKKYADFVQSYEAGLGALLEVLGVRSVVSQDELERYIAARVDVSRFQKEAQWGPDYSIVTFQHSFDESTWVFWNEATQKLEKWRSDSVRWYGPERLMLDDIALVKALLEKNEFKESHHVA
jgi:hypothetical protein